MADVAFYPMEADGANYPKAAVPLLPTASWSGLRGCKPIAGGSVFLQGGESFIQSRYALAEALRRAGAQPGKVVLLPSFHCRAIVEPVMYLGAQPCFYPVSSDLRPDFSALSALVRESGMPVAAMVLTHYFGFPNDIDEAERFCATHGIVLVEDCAHALYGRAGERLLGAVGSYATASIWKFLPTRDGGLLLDNTQERHTAHRSAQPLAVEIKAVAAIVQGWSRRVLHRSSLPIVDVPMICKQAELVAAQPRLQAEVSGLKEFSPQRAEMAALRSSSWLMRHAAHEFIAEHRCKNYLQWLEGVRSIPGVRPLFPNLPESVVPYAFPLLIDATGIGFHRLKMAGIPLWRWEDMAVTNCAISRDYRVRVLQLPCHQELRAEELDWMIRTAQVLLAEAG